MLSEDLEKLKMATNTMTSNPILDSISIEAIRYFECAAKENPVYAMKVSKMQAFVNKPLKMDINDFWRGLYNEYIEAHAYWYCSRKIYVERIPEAETNRPDYKIRFKNREYYLEIKSPFYLNTILNYRNSQEEGMRASIDIETQQREGAAVAMSEQVFQPYNNGKADYKPNSKLSIIEGLINKAKQNYKPGQYDLGDTVLLIDLRQLGISTKPNHSALPVYIEKAMGKESICSGELWSSAFSQIGDNVYYFPMDYPMGNIEGRIEHNGILIEYPSIRGLVFQTESMNNDKSTLVGFAKAKDYEILDLLEYLCDYYNDNENSRRLYLE